MPKTWLMSLLALPLLAQVAPKTGMQLSEFYLHDPYIVAYQPTKTYYLYNSAGPRQFGGQRAGVVTYKSKDLLHWDGPNPVFQVPDGTWANPSESVWAPEVHLYRGRYYLLATLHNSKTLLPYTDESKLPIYQGAKAKPHLRGTQIFVADTPDGPFTPVSSGPAPPADLMTLDGTLFVEDRVPYMVYAHEWIQVLDGTMEAVPLKADLSAAVGSPLLLFKASEAPWVAAQPKKSEGLPTYVTDGPCLYRTRNGKLLMLWSSYRDGLYVETLAYSTSGKLRGPWKQGDVLVGNDGGHGMLFESFDGKLMLVLHQPSRRARGKLFEMEDH